MILLLPVLLAPPAVRETPAMIQARWDRRLAGKPYSLRKGILERALSNIIFTNTPETIIVGALFREVYAFSGLGSQYLKVSPKEKDRTLLYYGFIAVGDAWSQADRDRVLDLFGGRSAPENLRFWNEIAPVLGVWNEREDERTTAIAARYPSLFMARLLRASLLENAYFMTFIGIRMPKVPLKIHEAAKREIDAGYAIATRLYGPDKPWNVEMKAKLDRYRKKAGQ